MGCTLSKYLICHRMIQIQFTNKKPQIQEVEELAQDLTFGKGWGRYSKSVWSDSIASVLTRDT